MVTPKPVLFIGPFPGPVSGQTVMTEFFYDALVAAAPPDTKIIKLNAARGTSQFWAFNMFIKQLRLVTTAVRILTHPRAKSCYLSMGANRGMANSLVHAFCARIIGAKLLLHHHSYSHISKPSALMRLMAKLAGREAMHICICDRMGDELKAAYPNLVTRTISLSNIVSIKKDWADHRKNHLKTGRLRLGHMSNLSFEKGLGKAISTLENLRSAGLNVELHLAGPPSNSSIKMYIAKKKKLIGDALVWKGPLYGAQKDQFFSELDLFLFPTDYKNETQGIVILEALAAGVPVLATARCCIHDDIGPLPGWTVAPGDDYSAAALALVDSMYENQKNADAFSKMAYNRFDQLKAESKTQMDDFIRQIFVQ